MVNFLKKSDYYFKIKEGTILLFMRGAVTRR